MAFGVVEDLLVDPSAGSLHPGGEPVDAYRLAGACHFHQPLAQVGQGGDEGPVGLAVAEGGQWTKQQVQAVADLGLGDPHHAAGPPVRQPVQHDRGDGVQADLQAKRRVAASSGWAGWEQVGEATGQPGEDLGGQRRPRAV